MSKKADRDHIRRQNRSNILEALRRSGPMARIDLGHITGLSPATVTAITSDLLEQGLIEGLEAAEPKVPQTRGRPRSLLRINPQSACVIVLRITVNKIDLALADFAGECFLSDQLRFDSATADATSFPALLIEGIRSFILRAGIAPELVREIGIAAQGVVELDRGRVAWSPAFASGAIPIVEPLSQAFGVHCRLSNDTNMITSALNWMDPAKYNGTFAVVMLDYGVGMGLYIDNQLFSGASGTAAEFGHANHMPNGALCRCGKRGCMEAYLSDYALMRSATGLPDTTDPRDIVAGVAGLASLIEKANDGDRRALEAFANAGEVLGYGLARLIAILDPSRIVLTGAAVRGYRFMEKAMGDALEKALVRNLRQNFVIDVMPWEEDFIRRGLIALAMERLDQTYSGQDQNIIRPIRTTTAQELTR
ncbi:ROK family transcriptional regulator [Roseibium limicola]|uniref:ROK family transcriptional regulator n=1 Tax=Roseibium limicola TaxID=2816037 RepID=A0A939JAE5_9HYPH|nr:ROK family transcriptional regulator [Roseibium limicola]MBO0346358.1 ROK family transcriptional regulator [Roseibium limicola]